MKTPYVSNNPVLKDPLFSLTLEKLEPVFKSWIQEVLQAEKPATNPVKDNSIEQPISQPDAIKFLGKSRQTLIKWRHKGVIHGHVLGGRVYYLKSELLEALTTDTLKTRY